jgi:hypothetical protein
VALTWYTSGMEPTTDNEIKALLVENQRLLLENNQLLHALHRKNVRDFWLRILWIVGMLVVPMIIYYIYIAPLVRSFTDTTSSLPGLQQMQDINELIQGL